MEVKFPHEFTAETKKMHQEADWRNLDMFSLDSTSILVVISSLQPERSSRGRLFINTSQRQFLMVERYNACLAMIKIVDTIYHTYTRMCFVV